MSQYLRWINKDPCNYLKKTTVVLERENEVVWAKLKSHTKKGLSYPLCFMVSGSLFFYLRNPRVFPAGTCSVFVHLGTPWHHPIMRKKHWMYQLEKHLSCIHKKIDPLMTKHGRQPRLPSFVWDLSSTYMTSFSYTTSFSCANTTVVFFRCLQGSLIICHRYWHTTMVPTAVHHFSS